MAKRLTVNQVYGGSSPLTPVLIALWCNGNISEFGSEVLGSSPSEAVKSCSCSPTGRGGCLKNSLCMGISLRETKTANKSHQEYQRGVAQLGSAAALGAEGCGFKSCHSDHLPL